MKKSVKVTLIVAAVLVGLGLCLAVAGLAMGGRFSDCLLYTSDAADE